MKLSVCTDSLFRGTDTVTAMEQLARLGMRHFEFWSWWDKDIVAIAHAKRRLRLQLVALCTRFVSLVDASRRAEYLRGLEETIQVAQSLGCSRIITQVGDALTDISRHQQQQTLIAGLTACVPLLERHNLTLLFEPLNTMVDHAGYYLSSADEAFQIARAVNSQHVRVLYDIYHQQVMDGNLLARISENTALIGHFHAAGCPGRHELDTGEISYERLLNGIAESSYRGFVGLEYIPTSNAVEGLQLLRRSFPTLW